MKFYIASRVKDRYLVKDIHKKLLDLGHEVTSKWVDENNIIPYEDNVESASTRAQQCIKDSGDCDVFILITDESGAGMYTEFGAALSSNVTTKGTPKIYVIGSHLNRSMFFFHPRVKRVSSFEEVLKDITE